jgi:hypothetical protein
MAFVLCVLQVYNAPCYILSDFLCLWQNYLFWRGRVEFFFEETKLVHLIPKKRENRTWDLKEEHTLRSQVNITGPTPVNWERVEIWLVGQWIVNSVQDF